MFKVTPPPPPKKFARRPDVVRRNQALEQTRQRFEGTAFQWGRFDCLTMVRAHLVAMGHRGLPKLPRYKNAIGAQRALKEQGVKTLAELMDRYLEPIAPAEALAGDIVLVPSEDDGSGEALMVSTGFKLWGWHPDAPAFAVIDPNQDTFKRAWRA